MRAMNCAESFADAGRPAWPLPGAWPVAWASTQTGAGGRPEGLGALSKGGSARLAGRRILIVEDEALLALDLAMSFEDAGAEVVGPAGNLQAGLRAVEREGPIDAAVLDVDLHGKDVYPIA